MLKETLFCNAPRISINVWHNCDDNIVVKIFVLLNKNKYIFTQSQLHIVGYIYTQLVSFPVYI